MLSIKDPLRSEVCATQSLHLSFFLNRICVTSHSVSPRDLWLCVLFLLYDDLLLFRNVFTPGNLRRDEMVMALATLLAACSTTTAWMVTPGSARLVARRTQSLLLMAAYDDEGGMVKEIAEGGLTLEQVKASYGAEGPKLSDAKAAKLVLPAPKFNIDKMDMSSTDADFELSCSSMGDAEVIIEIDPMMNTYEDYFYGLTKDSHPSFKIATEESSPIEGRMQRRGSSPEVVKLKCVPNGASGDFAAFLCFILENEPDFSKFYKITCKCY